MRITFLLLFFFQTFHICLAQTQEVWSDLMEFAKDDFYEKIAGEDQNSFYLLKTREKNKVKEIWLEQFDKKTLKLLNSNKILVPVGNVASQTFEDLFVIKNKLVLFTSEYNPETKINSAYYQLINSKGENIFKPTLVAEIESAQLKNSGNYRIVLSPDSSKFLISQTAPAKTKTNQTISFKAIDLNLQSIWQKTLQLPLKEGQSEIEEVILDEKSNVYFLVKIKTEKLNKQTETGNNYSLFVYSPTKDELFEYEIKLPKKFISSIKLIRQENKDILVAGFYTESPQKNERVNNASFGYRSYEELKPNIGGFYFLTVNAQTLQLKNKALKPLPKALLDEFFSQQNNDEKAELSSFLLKSLQSDSEGNFYLFAEQYIYEIFCSIDPRTGMQTCNDHYYYNDIVSLKIASNGEILQSARIPKSQQTINESGFFSSFLVKPGKNRIHFIFNDNPKNLDNNQPKMKSMSNPKRSVPVVETLFPSGSKTKSALNNLNNEELILRPSVNYQLSDKSIIIFAQKGKNYKFGRLIFDE